MAAYKTELRTFRSFEILYPVLWNGYPVLKNQELKNHDPVRWAAHTRIGNVWEYPPRDLPLVADVVSWIEGDFAARELTRTDFDFLHSGLALSDVWGVRLLLLAGVLAVDVIAASMNSYNWLKLRIFRPHELQTRSEYYLKRTNGNPTSLHISADTTPKHSFRFDDLNRFSEEVCFPRLLSN